MRWRGFPTGCGGARGAGKEGASHSPPALVSLRVVFQKHLHVPLLLYHHLTLLLYLVISNSPPRVPARSHGLVACLFAKTSTGFKNGRSVVAERERKIISLRQPRLLLLARHCIRRDVAAIWPRAMLFRRISVISRFRRRLA